MCKKSLLVTCWCLVVVHAISAAPDATTATSSRRRRQTSRSEYFVDIFVIIDYPVYTAWVSRSNPTGTQTKDQVAVQDIKRYFTLVIQEVSEQYSRLQTDFVIRFRPVGFHIATTPAESAIWTTVLGSPTATVNATKALGNLIAWLKNNSSRLPLYDHAMLFTGGDLGTDEKGHTKGKATVGTLCKQDRWQSVSIIEDHGGFESVQTAAHELGHSLSAKHDGLENMCSAADGYIMATGIYNDATSNRRNAWLFSICTSQEIKAYVTSGLYNTSFAACLRNQLNQTEVPSVASVVPGQLYAPESICKHLHGDASYFCYDGNAPEVCTSLSCLDPSVANVQCSVYVAPSGTSCGDKQWCQQGECVASTTAPSLPVDCPLGDANLIRWNNLTCPEVSRQQPHLCYKTEVQQSCCHSCGLIRTSVPGCEYGDKTTGCTPYHCSAQSSTCCRTCQSLQPACADQAAVDSLPCAAAVSRDGVQQCYNATVASLCCQTCSQKLNRYVGERPGCEYGDRRLQGCPVYQTAAGTSKTCDSQQCCQTCAGSVVCVGSFPLLFLAFTAATAFYWM